MAIQGRETGILFRTGRKLHRCNWSMQRGKEVEHGQERKRSDAVLHETV